MTSAVSVVVTPATGANKEGPVRTRRKLSIPAALSLAAGSENAAFRRRFSNVGDAARKLSTSIGWGKAVGATAPEEIVAVGIAMCTLYIRAKLKRSGVFNRKLGLTRVRSAVGTMEACSTVVREVYPALSCACSELERAHPKLFSRVARQTGRAPGTGIAGVLLAVGQHLLRAEPTWGKVAAVYSVAGGLAVDSARLGRPEDVHVIQEDMTELLEERMALWVHTNGGWNGLLTHCKTQDQEISVMEYFAVFGLMGI
ncbi:unnamed protein product, partial [Phaedon cochleariae]